MVAAMIEVTINGCGQLAIIGDGDQWLSAAGNH